MHMPIEIENTFNVGVHPDAAKAAEDWMRARPMANLKVARVIPVTGINGRYAAELLLVITMANDSRPGRITTSCARWALDTNGAAVGEIQLLIH